MEFIIAPYKVKDVTVEAYTTYKHRRNRHSSQKVTRYSVKFIDFNGARHRIFSEGYSTYSKAQNCADEIRSKFKLGKNIIKVPK